ncbi:hypothetical protein CCACVL1_01779, partial [Corchorus capsularis]
RKLNENLNKRTRSINSSASK